MRIISWRALREFWEKVPAAQVPLSRWADIVENADWQSFADVRGQFGSADQVGRLTVFNIGGNKYRLIVRVEYRKQLVYIRHVLTHAEYDKERWKDDPWFR